METKVLLQSRFYAVSLCRLCCQKIKVKHVRIGDGRACVRVVRKELRSVIGCYQLKSNEYLYYYPTYSTQSPYSLVMFREAEVFWLLR